jgi:hypothetical protein
MNEIWVDIERQNIPPDGKSASRLWRNDHPNRQRLKKGGQM